MALQIVVPLTLLVGYQRWHMAYEKCCFSNCLPMVFYETLGSHSPSNINVTTKNGCAYTRHAYDDRTRSKNCG